MCAALQGGVLCLRWLGELEGVFAACSGGQMLLLREGEWETVGELDGGLVCAEWSTDDEVLFCLTVRRPHQQPCPTHTCNT